MDITSSSKSSSSSTNMSWKLVIANIALRIIAVVFLSVSFTILNDYVLRTEYYHYDNRNKLLQFGDTDGYRYMAATIFLGIGYSALQIVLAIYLIIRKNQDAKYLWFEFFGDKVASYLLISGALAGFIASDDKSEFFGKSNNSQLDDAINKSNISASLLLLGFIFTAISSIISSYKLPMRSSSA